MPTRFPRGSRGLGFYDFTGFSAGFSEFRSLGV